MRVTICQQECGYLLKRGVFQKLLMAGRHSYRKALGYEVKVVKMTGYVENCEIPVKILMENQEFAARVIRVAIPDTCIALHFVNGTYRDVVTKQEALCWNVFEKNEFQLVDITVPEMDSGIPRMYRDLMPAQMYKKIVVGEGEVCLLYFDNCFERTLTSGTYYFWNYAKEVSSKVINMKVQQIEIAGQEILTADKVGVRLNVVCNYQITGPLELAQKMENVTSQLYTMAQLVLREYVGRFRLDDLLQQKEEISQYVYRKMAEREEEFFVKITQVGIKDIILPGEIREIMNTVLVAEKRAQANVIMRREEVASTRSLMNTARLMEENQTLYRLKEMEYLEKICDKVGNIDLSTGGGILEQLTALMAGTKLADGNS